MRARPRVLACLALALAVGACTPAAKKPVQVPAASAKPTVVAVPGDALGAGAGGILGNNGGGIVGNNGGGIVGNNGGGIVGNNAASLKGTVKAPPAIISDKGGGILGNNGGGIVGNNGGGILGNNAGNVVSTGGGGYRLEAVDQQAVAGARVYLLDARRRRLTWADGREIFAVTDAQGRYRFEGFAPTRNLLLEVALADGKGAISAVVPKGRASQEVDLDLVSSLATDYVYAQFVGSQADPGRVFDRLPPEVEAETRATTARALDAGKVPLPDRLTGQAVVATVDALRRADAALDRQLDAVRKLLVAAGQAELGEGRPATEVNLNRPRDLVLGPDGELYINARFDGRIWRLGADGRLATAAGSGGVVGPDGGPADARRVPLVDPRLARAADGRLLIGEFFKLYRLEAGGALTTLWDAAGPSGFRASLLCLVGAPDGGVLGLAYDGPTERVQLVAFAPDGTPSVRATFGAAASSALVRADVLARDAAGRLYAQADVLPGTPGAEAFGAGRPVFELGEDGDARRIEVAGPAALDPAGNVVFEAGGALQLRRPDGTIARLAAMPALPEAYRADGPAGALVGPGDEAYVVLGRQLVYRVRAGEATLVAGDPGGGDGAGIEAGARTFQAPIAVAAAADGTFFVADQDGNRVVRVTPDRGSADFAGTGAFDGEDADGTPAAAAVIRDPYAVRVGPGGVVYVLEGLGTPTSRIRTVDVRGTLGTAYAAEPGPRIRDFVVGPDGALYLSQVLVEGGGERQVGRRVVVVPPGGEPRTVLDEPWGLPQQAALSLALDPEGTLYVVGSGAATGQVRTWTREGGLQTLAADVPEVDYGPFEGRAACDARGRLYVSDGQAAIHRFDPATRTAVRVAGPEAPMFAGTGVDDGLAMPAGLDFAPDGSLLIADRGHKQIKRVPASKL